MNINNDPKYPCCWAHTGLENHFSALFDLLVGDNQVLGRCIDENGSKP